MNYQYDTADSPSIGPIDYSVGAGDLIIKGAYPLKHKGRLRHTEGDWRNKTTKRGAKGRWQTNQSRKESVQKPCGHWAMYAFVVFVPHLNAWCLGVQFTNGYKCFYPNSASDEEENPYYKQIVNSESGSYYWWDYIHRSGVGANWVRFA
jgi:hypothetical protein